MTDITSTTPFSSSSNNTMKLTLGALLLLSSTNGVSSFAPSHHPRCRGWTSALSSTPAPGDGGGSRLKKKTVLTAADVMAKANTKEGDPDAPGIQEAPKIFSPSIYDDFQSALLALEKRAKDGTGSLSETEVMKFAEETGRIVKEMNEYAADPEGSKARIEKMYGGDEAVDVTKKVVKPGDYFEPEKEVEKAAPPAAVTPPPPAAVVAPPPPVKSPSLRDLVAPGATKNAFASGSTPAAPSTPTPPPPPKPVAATPAVAAAPLPTKDEIDAKSAAPIPKDDEELPFDPNGGDGGFGLARGTANTYAIPGMDDMTPEEYRATLQETISARQALRRKSSLEEREGMIGNANSQNYLDGLSGGSSDYKGAMLGGNKKG